jgi:hypothetical protein
MPSPEEVTIIRAEIERLEKVRKEFADTSVQTLIDNWIEEHKRMLTAEDKPSWPS